MSKKREATAARIIAAIKDSKGLLTLAAQKAGLTYQTVWQYAQDYPSVKKAVDESKEVMLDFAEGKLYQAINAGDNTAIIFFLKTKGKSRGYIERQELTGLDGRPLETKTNVEIRITGNDIALALIELTKANAVPPEIDGNGHAQVEQLYQTEADTKTVSLPAPQ